jgi:Flp pilus assembly protein TadD
LNEVDAAFADAERAIELDRSDFNGWFARGALHASDGRFDKAQSDLLIAQNLVTADDLKYASIIEQILAFIEEAISSNG